MPSESTNDPRYGSALYPVREIPSRPTKPVTPGFCVTNPNILPRSCTWCGRPMRLVVPSAEVKPVVACDVCDHWGAWP